jgi:hypothetical protein
MRRIRPHLTYANVISTVCLFLLLGGGTALAAVVVTPNSEVAKDTISGHKPPSGKHSNIISGSLTAQDVANDSLGGGKINESALGKVPAAAAADSVGGKTASQLEGARAFAVSGGDDYFCPQAPPEVAFCSIPRNKGVAYVVRVGEGHYCVGVNGINAADQSSVALLSIPIGVPPDYVAS